VVVGIVSKVVDNQTKYLLMASTKVLGEFTGYYYPVGGHTKEGENESETLVREFQEELNVKVNPINRIIETLGDVVNQVTDWWWCELEGEVDIKYRKDEGVADIRWFSEEEIRKEVKIWPATRKVFLERIFK